MKVSFQIRERVLNIALTSFLSDTNSRKNDAKLLFFIESLCGNILVELIYAIEKC